MKSFSYLIFLTLLTTFVFADDKKQSQSENLYKRVKDISWSEAIKKQEFFFLTTLIDKKVEIKDPEKEKVLFETALILGLFNQSKQVEEELKKIGKNTKELYGHVQILNSFYEGHNITGYSEYTPRKDITQALLLIAPKAEWQKAGLSSAILLDSPVAKNTDFDKSIEKLFSILKVGLNETNKIEFQEIVEQLKNELDKIELPQCKLLNEVIRIYFKTFAEQFTKGSNVSLEDKLFSSVYKLFIGITKRVAFNELSARDGLMEISLAILSKTSNKNFDPFDKKAFKDKQNIDIPMIFCTEMMRDVMKYAPKDFQLTISAPITKKYKEFNVNYGIYLGSLCSISGDTNAKEWVRAIFDSEIKMLLAEAKKVNELLQANGQKAEHRDAEANLGFRINDTMKKMQFTHPSVLDMKLISSQLEELKNSGFSYGHMQLLKILENYEDQTKGGVLKKSVSAQVQAIKDKYNKKEINLQEYVDQMESAKALNDFDLMTAYRTDTEGRKGVNSLNTVCNMLSYHAGPEDKRLLLDIWYNAQRDSFQNGMVSVVEKRNIRSVLDDFLTRYNDMQFEEHRQKVAHMLMVMMEEKDLAAIPLYMEKAINDKELEYLGLGLYRLLQSDKENQTLEFLCKQLLIENLSEKQFFYYDILVRAKLNQPNIVLEKDLVKRKEQLISFLNIAKISVKGFNKKD